jgi:peptidoglycan/LPS O-acetylase OafA/YrhL
LVLDLGDDIPDLIPVTGDKKKGPKGSSEKIQAIGFARYLASVHIVMGHLYQGGNISDFGGFNRFGFTWVPWFFLLSGFVLSLSEQKRRLNKSDRQENSEDEMQYVLRRLEGMYPAYFLGLLASLITIWSIKGVESLPLPVNTLLFFCLLQSWLPSLVNYGFVYLSQCWFLSCLILYWLLFYRIYAFVDSLSSKRLAAVVGICSFLFPFLYHVASTGQESWYNDDVPFNASRGKDTALLVLKFHPFAYIHIFFLGCCLPKLHKSLTESNSVYLQKVTPFLSSIAYLALLILFCSGSHNIPGYKLGFRLGMISCVQCLLLLGLNNKNDILARAFSYPVLSKLGDYSFPQYVFQFLVLAWFQNATEKTVVDIRFFLLLFSTSIFISYIAAPFTNRKGLKKIFACVCIFLSVYLMIQPYLIKMNKSSARKKVLRTLLPYWWKDSSIVFKISGIQSKLINI